eukprot:scaffold1394_cov109-Isochrysis_galbana.AAC.22
MRLAHRLQGLSLRLLVRGPARHRPRHGHVNGEIHRRACRTPPAPALGTRRRGSGADGREGCVRAGQRPSRRTHGEDALMVLEHTQDERRRDAGGGGNLGPVNRPISRRWLVPRRVLSDLAVPFPNLVVHVHRPWLARPPLDVVKVLAEVRKQLAQRSRLLGLSVGGGGAVLAHLAPVKLRLLLCLPALGSLGLDVGLDEAPNHRIERVQMVRPRAAL